MLKRAKKFLRLERGQEININLFDDGTTEIETKGFKGEACYDAARFIEETLGKVSETRKTTEHHKKGEIREKIRH
ncbi:MAG: DUF2997 domain-containing protein [Proteobacteria bacterium]|nr:DUF2997 domain-containing protein [Pseudomonadota bacterium]